MAKASKSPNWWAYVPPPDQRVKRNGVRVKLGGRDYSGLYEIEGGKIVVMSAYGSRSAKAVSPSKRNAQAERLLEEIVGDASAPRLW
jgi:hypothetical protein